MSSSAVEGHLYTNQSKVQVNFKRYYGSLTFVCPRHKWSPLKVLHLSLSHAKSYICLFSVSYICVHVCKCIYLLKFLEVRYRYKNHEFDVPTKKIKICYIFKTMKWFIFKNLKTCTIDRNAWRHMCGDCRNLHGMCYNNFIIRYLLFWERGRLAQYRHVM